MTELEYIAEVAKLKAFHDYIEKLKAMLGLEDNGRTGMYTDLFNFFQQQLELLEKLVGDTNEYTSKYVYDTEFGKIYRTIQVGGRSLALKSAAVAYKAIQAYARSEYVEQQATHACAVGPTQSCAQKYCVKRTETNATGGM